MAADILWGPLPTVAQIEEIQRAVSYSYEAGDMPDWLSTYALSYTAGDGGLLHALAHLKRAVALLDFKRSELVGAPAPADGPVVERPHCQRC